ncbi:MAG: hypothetical protein IKK75_11770, partial [Clostridia bacterium]|nr:hypothetical protein [Clostridia bacterium]
MKKMNWFCLVLALLMCLCMLPATAGAATIVSPVVYTGEMDVDLPDNDELFAGYVERELNRAIYGDISMFGTLARDHLTDRQRKAYDVLKPQIEQIARGERASTVFVLDGLSDCLASTTITAEQLGVDAIFTVSGGYYTYTDEATQKIFEILKAELIVPVWQALIHDCPYDVYWRDSGYSYSFDVSYFDLTTIVLDSIELKIKVSVDYGSNYTVNTALASATSTAVANAKAIVEKHKAKDDWAKLEAYRDEIHALTDYNHPAADNDDTPYGDPWQLIYVFDKNPSTLVVCEGYSKAFKFLCDLSTFDGDVWCYCVSGLMDGGRHMWNIVTVDGVNYMADITNSDAGSIGQNGGLYMVDEPESGTWDTQYTFKPGNCTYKYDADVIDMWGEEVLKLGGVPLHTHSWGEPAYEWSEDFEDCFATNSCTDCGEEVTIEAIVLGYFTDGNCVTPTLYTYRAVFSEEWAGVQEKTIELGVEPDVHTGETVVKNAKEATCGEAGYTGDTHCAACDAKLSDGEAIPATEAHQFTEEQEEGKVPATCKDTGSVIVKCANCDATTTKELEIDPENHTGETVVKNAKEATCGEAGYTGDTHCAACDAKLSDGTAIDPTGAHSYTVEVEGTKVPATCVAEGKITKKCANCEATKEETL